MRRGVGTARRDASVALTEAHQALYAWLLDDTEQERTQALRDHEQRRLRRSA